MPYLVQRDEMHKAIDLVCSERTCEVRSRSRMHRGVAPAVRYHDDIRRVGGAVMRHSVMTVGDARPVSRVEYGQHDRRTTCCCAEETATIGDTVRNRSRDIPRDAPAIARG